MNSKLKKIGISFIIMIIVNLISSLSIFWELGIDSPHVGFLFVLGLLFGPYGALGAVLGNIITDVLNGFTFIEIMPSAIISFGVSYLAYKLWYSGFKAKKVTKPRLDTIYQIILFLSIILLSGVIYSSAHGSLLGIFYDTKMDEYNFLLYFLNFINIAFIFGVLNIWLSKKIDFVTTPKVSERSPHNRLYQILFLALVIVAIISAITLFISQDRNILLANTILIGILLFAYLTRPFKHEIKPSNENTIIEKILQNFFILTLTIAILGLIISVLNYNYLIRLHDINIYIKLMPALIITDVIIVLFFIPCIIILKYIETKVIIPISSFSEIESFIGENKKIEVNALLDIYSKYVDEKNEIGTLARTYTELIKFNNQYIENISEIEGEKNRILAELDIATKIQAASLPTSALKTDEFIVNGYSKPAKEVGGDFFDYYMIDEDNLAIVIGDASGKGVPAALLAMIIQVIIKHTLKHENDPSKVLYALNNELCGNNPESMFLTLWLGIYNKKTNKIIFSNAGHNPPLIRENGEFKYLKIDSGIVIGVMEDFDYRTEELTLTDELVLYTDGITDANNTQNKMYGEERLLKFLNEFKSDDEPIKPLLNDISSFTEDAKQFDDMTLLYLKIK